MIETLTITDRATWLEWRKGLLTASEIAIAAGLSEHMTPLELYLIKSGRRPPQEENELMRRGRHFEHAASEYVREDYPDFRLVRPRIFLRDSERRIGATPDVLLIDPQAQGDDPINCQIKTVAAPVFAQWNGVPPQAYFLQTAMENMLMDASAGILAVMVLSAYGAEMHYFDVPRDQEAEAKIVAIAANFWDRIERGMGPDPDFKLDAPLMRELYPPDAAVEAPADLTSDNRIGELLGEHQEAKASERASVARWKAAEAEIIAKLRGATSATAPGYRLTYKQQHRDEHVVKAADFSVLRIFPLKEQEEAA